MSGSTVRGELMQAVSKEINDVGRDTLKTRICFN